MSFTFRPYYPQEVSLVPIEKEAGSSSGMVWTRRRQAMVRVPRVARGTIFNGTPRELKYSNYDLIKSCIFNSVEEFDNFIIKFQNNVFIT
jgi:hypothetical protein